MTSSLKTDWEYSGRMEGMGKQKIFEASKKGKKEKIEDTKRQSKRWGNEGIRREGGLPRAHNINTKKL